jgi:hypothetical protein
VLPWEEGKRHISDAIKAKYEGSTPFAGQYERVQRALDTLPESLREAEPDITVIVSDDQDE